MSSKPDYSVEFIYTEAQCIAKVCIGRTDHRGVFLAHEERMYEDVSKGIDWAESHVGKCK